MAYFILVILLGIALGICYALLAKMDKHLLWTIFLKQSSCRLSDDLLKKARWRLILKIFVLLVYVSFQKLPSALMLAADSDAADCVTLLLDHNASVRDVDEKGYNALCRAILNGKK